MADDAPIVRPPRVVDPDDPTIPAELRDWIKVPSPFKFDGKRDPDTIRNWLQDMDNYATFYELNRFQRQALIPFYLSGAASSWWTTLKNRNELPDTWDRIEEAFKRVLVVYVHN